MPTLSLTHTLKHPNAAYAVAYSPDGERLATASLDNSVKLWNAGTGEELARLRGHGDGVCGVAFSTDGKKLFSASLDMSLRSWDGHSGAPIGSAVGHSAYLESMAVSPDGSAFATGGHDNMIRLWSGDGAPGAQLRGHTEAVYTVAFSMDGKTLASGGNDQQLFLWNIASGEKKAVSGHRGTVQSIVFSPDGKRFAVSAEQTIYFFNFSGESLEANLVTKIELDNLIKTLAFSHDGKWLAAGERDGKLRLFTASEGASVTSQDAHTNGIYGIAFSPDSHSLATASFDRTIKVWKLED
jgi:DNA-binding beta-propeller fold protein YncE